MFRRAALAPFSHRILGVCKVSYFAVKAHSKITLIKAISMGIVILIVVPFTALAQSLAQSTQQNEEPWYKVATDIIGILSAILTLITAFLAMRKINPEIEKSKQKNIRKHDDIKSHLSESKMEGIENFADQVFFWRQTSLIIVRFIILELSIRFWNFIPSIVSYILTFLTYGYIGYTTFYDVHRPSGVIILGFIPNLVKVLFDIVYWFIVFGFGWPLLRDTCEIIGFRISSIFDLPSLGKWGSKKE